MSKVSYDPEVKILSIRVSKEKIADSDMLGDCIVDYDSKGNIINIEILEISPKDIEVVKHQIGKKSST